MNKREQFQRWIESKMQLHKDDVDMLNYYRRNEGYLRDGFINGSESKQTELDKANYQVVAVSLKLAFSEIECAQRGEDVRELSEDLDKLNARIAQLQEALHYSQKYHAAGQSGVIEQALNESPDTWLSEHDKDVEIEVLKEAILRFENFGAGYEMFIGTIADELTCMIESRK